MVAQGRLALFLGIVTLACNCSFAASVALNDAIAGQEYQEQLTFHMTSPVQVKQADGKLPSKLQLSESGLIKGVPDAPNGAEQDYTFSVTATDSSQPPQTLTVEYKLRVFANAPALAPAQGGGECAASERPQISGRVVEGGKQVSGTANQPTQAGCTAQVQAMLKTGQRDVELGAPAAVSAGKFTIQLSDALLAAQKIYVRETFAMAGSPVPGSPPPSDVVTVESVGDWGRVRGYFTGRFLLSQDQGNFSQTHVFLAFTLDKTWRMACDPAGEQKQSKTSSGNKQPQNVVRRKLPGINTFFETRLTAIPTTSCSAPAASGASGSTPSACNPSGGGAPFDTFVASQKTARLDVGSYLPWTLTLWKYRGIDNALFLAPLGKAGFDTPAGQIDQAQPASVAAGGSVQPVNPTNFYTFYGYGARLGHYAMTSSPDEAPEVVSYLDIMLGRFSNLESFIQKPGSSMVLTQRLYRLSLEGILKVPSTPLIIGLSANVGVLGAGNATVVRRAGDDLRFLFGVKFDVGKLMARVTQVSP